MNKKELNKQKEIKKQDKQIRKENRKVNKTSKSFAEMIAYVDEYGAITDTPPDHTKRINIELENIVISTPKKEDIEDSPLNGRVEYFNTEKGYGFIKQTDSVESYFFHINNAPSFIKSGNIVSFELERGQKGFNAVRIAIIK